MSDFQDLISLDEYQKQLDKTEVYSTAYNKIFKLLAVPCDGGKDMEIPLDSPFVEPMEKLLDLIIEHTNALAYIEKLERQLKEKEGK